MKQRRVQRVLAAVSDLLLFHLMLFDAMPPEPIKAGGPRMHVRDHDRAEGGELLPRHRVGGDHDHPRHLRAADDGGDRIRRHGEREFPPARAGQDGEP